MTTLPRSERATQNRVVALFCGALGYRHLGDWQQRPDNRCIDAALLRQNLQARGHADAPIAAALHQLALAADVTGTTLYQANLRVYQLLRYGVPVQVAAGAPHETVHLIDWAHPEHNDFALAEEVTLKGGFGRRPDIVLYLNGLAVAVIELKRSSVDLGDGVRQLISNQEPIFNQAFFATAQLLLAGSDAQGLRYGTTGTPEQFFVQWKGEAPNPVTGEGGLLDAPLAELCNKARLLDWLRHFIVFDAGQKKVPRPHQFFGIKAAQARMARREGGVIWHTQGSGKSILMVLLAKWVLEHDPEARVLIVTDRDELDTQIEGVMQNAGVIGASEASPRISSRADFVRKLAATTPRLLCALVHKFDVADLKGPPPPISGRFYVFVDECHRTQGGDMNRQMKRWLAGALFIGFTGTPLLRRDKRMTQDVFGSYIHTYKFHQGVADEVILDLKYEARDVPQRLSSPAKVDTWFEEKTRTLNNFQKAALRRRWATLQELMSAGERKQRIIASIIEDFSLRPRLSNDRGTALLVSASIYDACHYYRLLQQTPFGPYCGIVTSYEPNHNAISREPANGDERYKYDTYTKQVLAPKQSTAQYEKEIKRRFIEEPARTKLLIVVSKLLTGFDAPSCTYIYLDQELRDHNLFQAICRTNRLDGDDKDYGHIVDFKRLFGRVEEAIAVYSSDELDTDPGEGGGDNNVRLKDWLQEGRKNLDAAREAMHYLCEPVPPPRAVEQYLQTFCGSADDPEALGRTEPLRVAYYKAVTCFVRAYAEIAQHMAEAGYTPQQAQAIAAEVAAQGDHRAAIKIRSGEELDIKPWEADMRHLLNTYVQADPAEEQGALGDVSLVQAIIDSGIHDAIARKLNAKGLLSRNAVAEGIINNVRKTIIREQLTDPRFYAQMSQLLQDLIAQSRDDATEYEAFLAKAEALVKRLATHGAAGDVPFALHGPPEAQVIYRNLPDILSAIHAAQDAPAIAAQEARPPPYGDEHAALALQIDRAMREHAPAGWRGDQAREAQVLNALFPLMQRQRAATQALFELIKNQPGYP